jgi:hypothetical protein
MKTLEGSVGCEKPLYFARHALRSRERIVPPYLLPLMFFLKPGSGELLSDHFRQRVNQGWPHKHDLILFSFHYPPQPNEPYKIVVRTQRIA